MLITDPVWQAIQEVGNLDGRRVYYLTETDSTNDVAMRLGLEGVPSNSLVVAESQSQGRGRLGRPWQSPPGQGLYVSFIIRPELALEDLPKITLTAGLAVCLAIEHETCLHPQIKWPNDIYLDTKKLGGILTETAPLKIEETPLVIIGMGLNINTPLEAFPDDLRERATSLAAVTGTSYARGKFLMALASALEKCLAMLTASDFAHILSAVRGRDYTVGRELTWVTTEGNIISGVGGGIDRDGVLHVIDHHGQEHEVLSGDITLKQK